MTDKQPVYDEEAEPNQGITPRIVHKICVELDISHYAFDLTNKCFLKHVCQNKNSHGPALVYYAVDNHMYYLDRDAKDEQGNNNVRSLNNEAVAVESKHQSLIVRNSEPASNIYNEREIKETSQ